MNRLRLPIQLLTPGLLLLAGMASSAAYANEFYLLSLGAGNEDNLPHVPGNPAAAETGLVTADLTGGKYFQLGLNHSLELSAQLSSRRYFEHSGFDAIGVSLAAGYGYKFGLGAYAPRLGAVVSLGKEEMDGDARDRDIVTTQVNYSQRLSPAWLLTLGIDYEVSRGKSLPDDPILTGLGYDPDTAVSYALYDDDAVSVFADIGYEMANGFLLTGSYTRIHGYTIATTQMPTLKIYKQANAVYVDPAWPDLWIAYRLQSDTDVWSLGLSMPVGRDSSIDLGASWQDINGPQDLGYRNRALSINYVHSF